MRITLPSGTPAESVEPPGGRGGRGLVIASDIAGLRPLFDDMCRSLAEEHGWAVCAVELWPGREHLDAEQKWALVPEVDERAVLTDLEAAAQVTGRRQVGLAGFCMGGMYAFRAAGGTTAFDRVVSFYGMIRLPPGAASATQHDPIDSLRHRFVRPTLAIVGGRDSWCPTKQIDELQTVSSAVEVVRYPDAGHGFVHDPTRASHRPADAADAWRRSIAFLESSLPPGE